MTELRRCFEIDGVSIGAGLPAYVIAEIGVNHNGDVGLAKQLIEIAASVGAQCAKLQSFSADRLVAPTAPKAPYQLDTTSKSESQHAMLRSLELSEAAHRVLFDHARDCGITLLSTPFDEQSADMLDDIGMPAFKVSSGDLTHPGLLRHLAAKGKPILLSTGMANIGEVQQAVDTISAEGNAQLALFHCVSVYPAAPADANLRAMATMAAAFGVPIGWSDHTVDPAVACAAVALGACIVEKHITLDKGMAGPDHRASADPDEFRAYVAAVRTVESALGDGLKRMRPAELAVSKVARRSLVTLEAIQAGSIIRTEQVGARRPGTGLDPSLLPLVVGRKAARDIPSGTVLDLEMIA